MDTILFIVALVVLPAGGLEIAVNRVTVEEAQGGRPGTVSVRAFPNTEDGVMRALAFAEKLHEGHEHEFCFLNAGPSAGSAQDMIPPLTARERLHDPRDYAGFAAPRKLGPVTGRSALAYCRHAVLSKKLGKEYAELKAPYFGSPRR